MGKYIVLLLIVALQSCSKNVDPKELIAKDPLAVVHIKSMKSLKASLPPQAMMAVSMAEGAAVGLDNEKSILLVLTTLNPVSAYLVLPVKGISKKDQLVNSFPAQIKTGVKTSGNNLLVPLYGSLPTVFAKYEKLNDSELSITANLEAMHDKYGDYISKKMKEGGSLFSESVGESEQNLITGIFGFYEVLVNEYLKNSKQLSIDFTKSDQINIDFKWEFKEGSAMSIAAASLMNRTIPKAEALSKMPMYYAMSMNWKDVEPLFGSSIKALDPLYKAMNLEIDFTDFMDAFKKMGDMDAVGGMAYGADLTDIKMHYIFKTENNSLLKQTLNNWFEKLSEKENPMLLVKKSEEKFSGDFLYEMSTKVDIEGSVVMNTFLGGDENGYYYGNSLKNIEELSKIDLKKDADKGYFKMRIDYGKLIPQSAGVSPMNFVLNATGAAEKNALTFKLTFE